MVGTFFVMFWYFKAFDLYCRLIWRYFRLLIGYAEFCVLVVFLSSETGYDIHQAFNAMLFHIFAVLAFASHARTMFTDPVIYNDIHFFISQSNF